MIANSNGFKVCVRSFTFNHSKYITDAMNGFCSQETNFPYVCCIVDDASTDGEPDVICEYVEKHFNVSDSTIAYKKETDYAFIIFAQHNVNKNCFFAVLLLKENHWGKKPKMPYLSEWRDNCYYEAICEGDDYWSNKDKLQIQSEYLDNNPNCALCYGKCRFHFVNRNAFSNQLYGGPYERYDELMKENTVHTPTVMYRLDAYKQYVEDIQPSSKRWILGDYPMWLYFSHNYSVHFFEIEFAVYRFMQESASHSNNDEKSECFVIATMEVRKFFAVFFNTPDFIKEDDIPIALFLNAVRIGNRDKAIELYKSIKKPSVKQIIKYHILKNRFVYGICKDKLFITIR